MLITKLINSSIYFTVIHYQSTKINQKLYINTLLKRVSDATILKMVQYDHIFWVIKIQEYILLLQTVTLGRGVVDICLKLPT